MKTMQHETSPKNVNPSCEPFFSTHVFLKTLHGQTKHKLNIFNNKIHAVRAALIAEVVLFKVEGARSKLYLGYPREGLHQKM